MRRLFATLAAGLIGGGSGYFIGVYVACDWLYPTSSLCGIYGVFITAPIGSACGAVVVGSWGGPDPVTKCSRSSTPKNIDAKI